MQNDKKKKLREKLYYNKKLKIKYSKIKIKYSKRKIKHSFLVVKSKSLVDWIFNSEKIMIVSIFNERTFLMSF